MDKPDSESSSNVGQAFQRDVRSESLTYDADDALPGDEDPALAELTEEVARRLESGEPVNGGDLGENPSYAGDIRQLLPTLRTIVSLGEQVARVEAMRTRVRKTVTHPRSPSFSDQNPEGEEVAP